MGNDELKDDGIEYIDLDNSDDGIQIMDADELDDLPEKDSASGSVSPSPVLTAKGDDDNRRSIIIRRIIMTVSATVFLFSAGMLIYIFMGYHKADKIYDTVENSVFVPVEPTKGAASDNSEETASREETVTSGTDDIVSGFTYDHAALLEINTDSVGYMVIPAIDVCLPIVQGSDNSFYLDHAVTGTYSGNGALFVDYRIEEGLEASNSIIYGHAMKNGAMFGSLYRFKNASFFNSGSNDTFYIYSKDKMYTYRIYSVHTTPAVSTTYSITFSDDASFITYASEMKEQSVVATKVSVVPGDKTVTLSTCTDDENERLVVQAVRTAETTLVK